MTLNDTDKMRNILLWTLLLTLTLAKTCLYAQDLQWQQTTRVHTTIDNITYYFPSHTPPDDRMQLIGLCQKAIKENITLLHETDFTDTIDVQFISSRAEMNKIFGIKAQGMAVTQGNTFYCVLKSDYSVLKHEIMHMIAYYKWGPVADWLDEGFATYAGGNCSGLSLEALYQYYIQTDRLIPIDALVTHFFSNHDMIAYTQSAFIAQYLIERYGYDKFKRLWKEGFEQFAAIYGTDYAIVAQRIKEELQRKYPEKIPFDWERFNKGC